MLFLHKRGNAYASERTDYKAGKHNWDWKNNTQPIGNRIVTPKEANTCCDCTEKEKTVPC